MSICAPKPFGSKFLKGGYSYWPLWWYGQKNKLHDMSGHGNDLTPSGAYFDGQGYYFVYPDCMLGTAGNYPISRYTVGSWHSLYLTDDEVPPEGTAIGTGTKLAINLDGNSPKLTGKIALYPEYCPNITYFNCRYNNFSAVDVSRVTTLESFGCFDNNISTLDVSALTKLSRLWCHNNSMDESAVDAVLCDLASHTTENGTLTIQGNAPPSPDGEDCRDILVARGWSVTIDEE